MGCAFCSLLQPHPFSSDFDWVKKIGDFSRGEIWECRRKMDLEPMVCKIIRLEGRTKGYVKHMKFEIRVMEYLSRRHPAFLNWYEARKFNNQTYVFIQLCKGGTLNEHKLNVEEAKRVLKQLTSALRYLHHKKIAHLDIRPVIYITVKKLKNFFGRLNFAIFCLTAQTSSAFF